MPGDAVAAQAQHRRPAGPASLAAAKDDAAQFPGNSVGDQMTEIKEPAQGLIDTAFHAGSPIADGRESRKCCLGQHHRIPFADLITVPTGG